MRKIGDHFVPGLFAGTTGENSSRTINVAVKCPVHKSTNHKLQGWKVFQRMSTNEKEQVVDEHRLCLSCLLPGHRVEIRIGVQLRVVTCVFTHSSMMST